MSAAIVLAMAGCSADDRPTTSPRAGTPDMRAALFDTILARTERREAWSPAKLEHFDFDPLEAMRALRDEVVAAETDDALFYALARLSAARRDRHLSIAVVPGGLQPSDIAGLDVVGADDQDAMRAPVRVFPDFSEEGAAFFVGDVADADDPLPPIGSRVQGVNGLPVQAWLERATAYMRHSTTNDLRWELADAMTQQTAIFPSDLRGDGSVTLAVRHPDGSEQTYELSVCDPASLDWEGIGEPSYEGFERVLRTVTYDMLVDDDREVIVLIWTGFRVTMVVDVNALVELAAERDMLDYTLVVDVTRSGGGSRGAYAVQRLQPKPIERTIGAAAAWVERTSFRHRTGGQG